MQLILGIETSCDETGAAIYDAQKGIIANALFSQSEHRLYGGVVPEIASRTQLEKINLIVQEALDKANLTIDEIDAIAVTSKPGLAGSLLVGLCFAKALAFAKNKKLIGINHLEGHAFSPFLEHNVPFPHLCLSASGGHTSLYLIKSFGDYELLGQTLDDAAGEAFDKIAKCMNYPYPGGPVIEQLAREVEFKDFFKYPRSNDKSVDFSFSGLKTAVLYDLVKRGAYDLQNKIFLKNDDQLLKQHVASSLLTCISDIFVRKLSNALTQHPEVKAITMVGGVACNKYIKEQLKLLGEKHQLPFFAPSPQYCTDNGAMIALVGAYRIQQGYSSDLYLDIFE